MRHDEKGYYTGSRDKNGEKLHVGDVVKCKDGEDCTVEWWPERTGYGLKRTSNGMWYSMLWIEAEKAWRKRQFNFVREVME